MRQKRVTCWAKSGGESVSSQPANYITPVKDWPGWFALADRVPGNGGDVIYYHVAEWADHVGIEDVG